MTRIALCAAALPWAATPVFGQYDAWPNGASDVEAAAPKSSSARHSVRIDGQTVKYTAMAGWLILARERIRLAYYEAGHMMYLHEPSLQNYRDDLARFIRDTDRL